MKLAVEDRGVAIALGEDTRFAPECETRDDPWVIINSPFPVDPPLDDVDDVFESRDTVAGRLQEFFSAHAGETGGIRIDIREPEPRESNSVNCVLDVAILSL